MIKSGDNHERRKETGQQKRSKKSFGGGYVTQNSSLYKSGDTPKFKVGDFVKVEYYASATGNNPWVTFLVTGVSSTRNGGEYFKEFTYTVMKVGAHDEVLKNVYESCLRRA